MRKNIWGNLFAFPLRKQKQNKISRFSFVIVSVQMVTALSKRCQRFAEIFRGFQRFLDLDFLFEMVKKALRSAEKFSERVPLSPLPVYLSARSAICELVSTKVVTRNNLVFFDIGANTDAAAFRRKDQLTKKAGDYVHGEAVLLEVVNVEGGKTQHKKKVRLPTVPIFQARKRNPNLNFLVRIFSGGVGVFHVKGWGAKSSVCPSNQGNQTLLAGYPGILPGYPGGARKVWEKKVWCSIFVP